jgi:hypothetical protein
VKVGFVFECGPQGADKQVCEYLAQQIRPGITLVSRTLDNKPNLLKEAGNVARALLADGCDRVLVIWDLRPAWPEKTQSPCRKQECDEILASLLRAEIAGNQVFLVCVEQELESWLLADEKKIAALLSTDAHPVKIRKVSKPDQVQNPKSAIMKLFREHRGWRYEDHVHAIRILSSLETNLKSLRRSPTFSRFELKLS